MAFHQHNMLNQEELAALLERNLSFQPQPIQVQEEAPRPEEPITYSITQHYHHSAHIAQQVEQPVEPQRPSSEPPQSQQNSAESILLDHGVNYRALSASQMELFKTAEDTQKLRLIELWRICPPSNNEENPAVAFNNTTVEQEEMLAQLRYERKLAEEEQKQSVMSLDGTPLTPVQTGEGRWINMAYSEPYMISGYEALAQREYEESAKQTLADAVNRPKDVYLHFGSAVGGQQYRTATDPVYNADWERQQQSMENQYGAFQQMDGDMEL